MNERSIFLEALDLEDAREQAAYLRRACGGDHQLLARVEALLRSHRSPGRFILDGVPATDLAADVDRPVGPGGPGTVLGPYRLIEPIGEGGMGLVFVAEQHCPVHRRVALKVIKPGMDSRQVIARFEAERQALALMDHPNIAKVHDAGATESGRPYFAMELVDGIPITDYCDREQLPIAERLGLFVQVCRAVQHAHQKGVIHRDLKPSNILVTVVDGVAVPKVIDFGIAKATGASLTERTLFTGVHQLVGTPLYMSPEQAEMGGLDVDTRSDIYSLGVLLYELLTGSTPFGRGGAGGATFDEMVRSLREREPQTPSSRLATTEELPSIAARRGTEPARLGRLVRGDLDWIVMTALEKDRDRRYQTANSLAMDLQRYLADEPVVARPPSLRDRLRKFARRNKGPVLAASLVALALVGGVIGTTWGLIRATDARAVAVNQARQREAALVEARGQLFEALWNRARAGRFSRQPGQRLDSLDALARAARIRPDDRLRDEAIAAMALPDIRGVPFRRTSPPGTSAMAYGGQYQLYARADTRGTISIRSLPDDREIRRIDSDLVSAFYLSFSPDDRFLLGLGEGNTLRVWRVADGGRALPDDLRDCRTYPAFSPDGRWLAVGRQDWVLCFDLATGQEVRRWRLPVRAHALAFHPDNGKLAVGYSTSKVASVYDAASGTLLADLPVGAMSGQVVAWHPDGDRLAVAGDDPRIQIWNVAARRQVATLAGHAHQVAVLTFRPEGDLLASHSWDGTLRLWEPSTGRSLLQLPLADDAPPRFSGDGRWVGVARQGERAELLEVTPSREYRTLVSSAGTGVHSSSRADFSPDGRLLAAGMDEGTRLWDMRSGREIAALPAGATSVFFDRRTGEGSGPATPDDLPWSLLTGGPDGLLRWPVTSADPRGERLRLGPPRRLSPQRRARFSRGPDGRTLVAMTELGGVNRILDLETATVRRELGVHPAGEVLALSGDGRWAASSGLHSDRVRLWDVATGRVVREWVLGKINLVSFTPDSRALIIAQGDEFSFWDVATLRPILRLPRAVADFPGYVAFSPDGRLVALEMAPAVIHLKETATGRTVARLEDPHGDRAGCPDFSPDGTRLVVVVGFPAVHVWDLRAIRARLKAMDLDWDWPEFPPAAAGDAAAGPVTIEVDPGDLVRPRTIEHWRHEVEANPDSANACNSLAWAYLTAPEALRDVAAAVTLAENAVRLEPGSASFRNTLGVAYYRDGRYDEAVEVVRPNLRGQEDRALAYDLYVLAVSHHRLGETARARDCYDLAVRWARAQRGRDAVEPEELSAFRAEAEKVLGIGREDDRPRGVGGQRPDAPVP